ncbi:hypothetical protein F2Q70_00030567 [Brassica cretica]|uniref:DUF223 domain-containing protein n=2 Tax=Brassica cretica TaxID=69181 RepID=A0A8S9FEE6_BRACR|nr:hypothetical protein F2Q70_00030567 [Brassica cretica]
MLDDVVYNKRITALRFRVKILRIHSFHSYVSGIEPNWSYILVDEAGTKMEMTIYTGSAYRFRDLENQEGKLSAMPYTKVHIIDPLNNHHYMKFKCINDIPHIMNKNYLIVVFNTEAHFDDPAMPKMVFYIRDNMRDHGEVILVLKMWRICRLISLFDDDELRLETKGGLSDRRFNPRLPKVDEFRQSLLCRDLYVHRHGAMGPL